MKNLILLTLCFFASQVSAIGKENPFKKAKPNFDSIQTLFQKIQKYEQLEIVLNFDSLISSRRKDIEHQAQLTLKVSGQPDLKMTSKIRPRGRFRRLRCDIPPIRLNFEKPALKAMNLYQKYDKLKLVTHCYAKEVDAKYLLKEYWTYRLFNEVTDSSFRVHLLEITFIDEVDPTNRIESYAFVIENSDEMAHRLNGELVDGLGIEPSAIAPNSYHNTLVFNYMIGNSDWQIRLQKNLKMVKHRNSELYTLVPYDFDFATIVNPPYLKVGGGAARLELHEGDIISASINKNKLNQCIDNFKLLKKTGFTCFNKCDKLGTKEKLEMNAYIKSFYKKTKKQEQFVDTFLSQD